jgi:hypothetical protein
MGPAAPDSFFNFFFGAFLNIFKREDQGFMKFIAKSIKNVILVKPETC